MYIRIMNIITFLANSTIKLHNLGKPKERRGAFIFLPIFPGRLDNPSVHVQLTPTHRYLPQVSADIAHLINSKPPPTHSILTHSRFNIWLPDSWSPRPSIWLSPLLLPPVFPRLSTTCHPTTLFDWLFSLFASMMSLTTILTPRQPWIVLRVCALVYVLSARWKGLSHSELEGNWLIRNLSCAHQTGDCGLWTVMPEYAMFGFSSVGGPPRTKPRFCDTGLL